MKQTVFLFMLLTIVFSCKTVPQQVKVDQLSCNYFTNPLGVESQNPELSWIIQSDQNDVKQSAYKILVADNETVLAKDSGNVWDSGKVGSDQSIRIPYGGPALQAGAKYFWKVKVWGQSGSESEWSPVNYWQMGLLNVSEWDHAQWLGYEAMAEGMRIVPGEHGFGNDLGKKGKRRPVIPYFRRQFDLTKNIASATLYISGVGQYDAYLNGSKIGDAFLTPGWTDYDKTVFYDTYDVTSMLQQGENAVGVIVGNGFYNVNRERYRKLVIAYGMPKMICKLAVTYDDGSTTALISDSSWKTSPSPITYSSIYGGEDYDARKERSGWNKTGFDDSSWKQAILVTPTTGKLNADMNYPVKVMNTFEPQSISKLADDQFTYDFGQNVSGIVELKVKGKKGQEVRLIPAELVHPDSTANQNATGKPYYYTYTLKGHGVETWHPKFTYYGMRYVQVEGAVPKPENGSSDLPVVEDLKLLHTRNSAPGTGSFECSNELFNRINQLIKWAIKSNMQSVLTDCPHREKLGWMEQTFLMGSGIHFNYDIYHLYKKLVYGMMDAQQPDGLVPAIEPEYVNFGGDFRDSPEWGSASVQLPWLIYQWYGDKSVMADAWPMMVKYVDYLKNKSDHEILSYGLGDWYDLGPNHPGYAQLTPKGITATSIYYSDVKLLAKMAVLLNKSPEEQKHFEDWATDIKTEFNKEFFNPETKVYATGSQTSMAMPLVLSLVEDKYKQDVLNNLVDSIHANNKALTAGDIGFHYLVKALEENGQSQLLFEMNNRDDVPGYGYQLRKGATTLTESWQGLAGVSNNHLMLGHIMEWFYQGIGGIQQVPGSSAYKEIVISPEVVGDLTYAKTSFHSPHGEIKTNWEKKENSFVLDVQIPANTTATVYLPFEGDVAVSGESRQTKVDYKSEGIKSGRMAYSIGSGNYVFNLKLKKN